MNGEGSCLLWILKRAVLTEKWQKWMRKKEKRCWVDLTAADQTIELSVIWKKESGWLSFLAEQETLPKWMVMETGHQKSRILTMICCREEARMTWQAWMK